MPLPSFRLDGQVAAVTGTGSGLGRAIALGLAESGADVVLTELPCAVERAEETAAEVRALGRQALVVPLDVRAVNGENGVQAFADAATGWQGHVEVLVNNAGVQIAKPALEFDETSWDTVLDVDLKGVFYCAQAIGRHMVERKRGAIVNISSQNGVIGYYKRAAYCAAKAGVNNVARVLALEWAEAGVRVNTVAPTFARTPLTEPTFADPEIARDLLGRIPLGRLVEPEEIAAACVFLASPAAGMITGHTLLVDGGWTAI